MTEDSRRQVDNAWQAVRSLHDGTPYPGQGMVEQYLRYTQNGQPNNPERQHFLRSLLNRLHMIFGLLLPMVLDGQRKANQRRRQ